MSQTYKWGDKVWVESVGQGRCKGIVLEPINGSENYPLVTCISRCGTMRFTDNFRLADISPRDDEPRPRTWRLPEEGDTIRAVGDKVHESWKQREYKIAEVRWQDHLQIGVLHDLRDVWFSVYDVELVRLHDDPTPADHVPDAGEKVEPKQDPWSGPCDPIGDLKAMMKLDAHRKIGLSDHVVDANKKVEPTFDPVTKARHYNLHPSGVECITIAKHMNFCLGSALKYIFRADNKGTPIQDLRKAIQFLEYEIERRQELEASRGT